MNLDPKKSQALAKRVAKLLAGKDAATIGAALAELLATWVAAHHVPDNPAATRELRAKLLKFHLDTVKKLIPVNAAIIGTTQDAPDH